MKVKQLTPALDKKGVVYKVPCGECNHVYIGEMGRTLRKRLTKHKVAVRKCDNKDGIATVCTPGSSDTSLTKWRKWYQTSPIEELWKL